MKIFYIIFAVILIISGIVVSYVFFNSLSYEYTFMGADSVLLDKSGQVGDFIGGVVGTIFSLAGFIFLLITLLSQSDQSYINQFESKYFELLKFQRDNVNELELKRKLIEPNNDMIIEFISTKRHVFKTILSDFIICRNELKPFFKKYSLTEIYTPQHLEYTMQMLGVDEKHERLKSYARINISYNIIYFGVGSEGVLLLQNIFAGRFQDLFISEVLNYIKMKPIQASPNWKKWNEIKRIRKFDSRLVLLSKIIDGRSDSKNISKYLSPGEQDTYYYSNEFIKFYGGHQHRLGHYFRHLYQTVNYVNSQRKLSRKQKYFYVKTLRAQLSTYEQALLFVNSLSYLGLSWELDPEYSATKFKWINDIRKKNHRLITEYNLIKNLPGSHIYGINYRDYYPRVDYEVDSHSVSKSNA